MPGGTGLVPSQVWMRVFRIAGEDAINSHYGSAVVIELDGRQVLVTADHLTTGEPEECFSYEHAYITQGSSASATLVRLSPRVLDVDVAVFDFPRSIVDLSRYAFKASSIGAAPSQDAFLLGHPYGLHLQLTESSTTVRMPLTKRGILAGGKWIGASHYFLIDCIANPGFSGGPAVFRHIETDAWQLLGIVKGQFKQDAASDGDVEREAQTPAGITAVAEINTALTALGLTPCPVSGDG